MKKTICCLVTATTLHSYAQDGMVKSLKADAEKTIVREADTAIRKWKKGGNFSLNVNQGTLSNWSAGGDRFSFSLNSFLNAYAFYKKEKFSWDNNLDLGYGVLKTSSLGSRKASDRIEFTSKIGHELRPRLNLATLINIRSQFAKGYGYLKNIAGTDSAVLSSRRFQPTYLLLSLAIDYKPTTDLSLFLSPVTGRWVIASDRSIGPIYGLDPGKSVKKEFGAYFSGNYLKKISPNIVYKGKLDLFSNYENNPQNIDVFFSNCMTAKISKYINFSVNLDIIYDDDTRNVNPDKGPAPQILQLSGIGFAYKFKADRQTRKSTGV